MDCLARNSEKNLAYFIVRIYDWQRLSSFDLILTRRRKKDVMRSAVALVIALAIVAVFVVMSTEGLADKVYPRSMQKPTYFDPSYPEGQRYRSHYRRTSVPRGLTLPSKNKAGHEKEAGGN